MLASIIQYRKHSIALIATYSTSAFYFAYWCGWLCRLLNIPYVPCLHGGNLPERIATSPRLVRQYFGNSAMNVAVSGYLQQALLANGWQCIVISNAISIAQYPIKLRTTAKPKLLWVRSFHKVYNPQLAVQVLFELRKTYNNATLTMVGPDKDGSFTDCKKLATSLQILEQITFTGKLSQKEWTELATTHDIFINTTTADNLPVSVIEAMSLGLIVISTNVGGIPFLIQNEVNGLLCEMNSMHDMVEKIVCVCQDETLSKTLSANAYATSKQFDEATVIRQWKTLLAGL